MTPSQSPFGSEGGGGTLAGIARHDRPKGPMETVERVEVTLDGGIEGDFRGTIRPGGMGRRQISLIEAGDWATAMGQLGTTIPWWERRANLLVEGLDLPQRAGARVRVGKVLLEITTECNPCSRMDALAPGLQAALTPDWRGGALARVIEGGVISIGDRVALEE